MAIRCHHGVLSHQCSLCTLGKLGNRLNDPIPQESLELAPHSHGKNNETYAESNPGALATILRLGLMHLAATPIGSEAETQIELDELRFMQRLISDRIYAMHTHQVIHKDDPVG